VAATFNVNKAIRHHLVRSHSANMGGAEKDLNRRAERNKPMRPLAPEYVTSVLSEIAVRASPAASPVVPCMGDSSLVIHNCFAYGEADCFSARR
jgi:hypothetical protein